MRRVFLLVIFAVCAYCLPAQKISSVITLQDGTKVGRNHVFVEGESGLFFIDGQGYDTSEVNWTFDIYTNEKKDRYTVFKSKGTSFKVSTDLQTFRELNSRRLCHRFIYDGDSSVYYKGVVCMSVDDIEVDSIEITFNLLPSRPKTIVGSLTGEFDWDNDFFGWNAKLQIEFQAERMDSCRLAAAISDTVFLFKFPSEYLWFYCIVDLQQKENGNWLLTYPYAEWGEFYQILARNKYGAVLGSDTIFTTNYIHDEEILKRIWQYDETSSVKTTEPASDAILFDNNILHFDRNYAGYDICTIYTISGKMIMRRSCSDDIDMSSYSPGMYILNITDGNGKTTRKKLLMK